MPRKEKKGTGRPAKLSPETISEILGAVEEGATAEDAAECAGISRATLFAWQAKAKTGDETYRDFLDSLTCARARCRVRLAGLVAKAAHGDWRAGGFWLERQDPEHWGRREKIENTHEVRPPRPPLDPRKLSTEELVQLERLMLKAKPDADHDGESNGE